MDSSAIYLRVENQNRMTKPIKEKKQTELNVTVTKGRIRILKVADYKGSKIYIRLVDKDLFEWMLIYKNEIYSSYIVVERPSTRYKFSKDELKVATNMLWMGATATIDTLLGVVLDKDEELRALKVVNLEPEKK